MMKILFFLLFIFSCLFGDVYYINDNKKVYLKEDLNLSKNNDEVRWFRDKNNLLYGVKNEIIFVLKKAEDKNNVLNRYSLILKENISDKILLVKTNLDVFEISNQLYNDDAVLYAHPNFITKVKSR